MRLLFPQWCLASVLEFHFEGCRIYCGTRFCHDLSLASDPRWLALVVAAIDNLFHGQTEDFIVQEWRDRWHPVSIENFGRLQIEKETSTKIYTPF